MNRARLDDRSKCIGEVNTGALAETSNHPVSLVSLKGTIESCLMMEHPLPDDDVGVSRLGDKLPSPLALQHVELLLHHSESVRVAKIGANC